MVTMSVPDFMDWVEVTMNGWELKDSAPVGVKQDFELYMQGLKMAELDE